MGSDTATCPSCDIGWRGPQAHEKGMDHEKKANHVVWYDHDPEGSETETVEVQIKWTRRNHAAECP